MLTNNLLMYVGTYNQSKNGTESHPGIYIYRFDTASGKLTSIGEVSDVANPSFLCLNPSGQNLYAPNEVSETNGEKGGGVTSFAIDRESGALTKLSSHCTGGGHPCHVNIDQTGKWLCASNYSGGNFAVFPILGDGSVGPRSAFVQHEGSSIHPHQKAPHVHSSIMSPDNKYLMVADLGIDRVGVYELDHQSGTVTSKPELWAATKPGAGPRHMVFHQDKRFFYVVNELNSTVTAFSWEASSGKFKEIHTVPMLPPDYEKGGAAADIHIDPQGKFLYASNRGHDSLAIYSINCDTGELTPAGHSPTLGREPRNFGLDPSGEFVIAANHRSDTIFVFKRDSETGQMEPTGEKVDVPSPVCVRFLTN